LGPLVGTVVQRERRVEDFLVDQFLYAVLVPLVPVGVLRQDFVDDQALLRVGYGRRDNPREGGPARPSESKDSLRQTLVPCPCVIWTVYVGNGQFCSHELVRSSRVHFVVYVLE
jgi:hypothetical protein